MRYLPLLLLAAGAALLAGCLDRDDANSSGNGDGDMNESTNTTTSLSMDFQAAGPGPLAPTAQTFEVPANATSVILEARWECTSPTCAITMTIMDPNGTEVASQSGNGQADLQIEAPAPGTYSVEFAASAPLAGVTGETRVTVFTGEVPDGFTAWEDAEAARYRASGA